MFPLVYGSDYRLRRDQANICLKANGRKIGHMTLRRCLPWLGEYVTSRRCIGQITGFHGKTDRGFLRLLYKQGHFTAKF